MKMLRSLFSAALVLAGSVSFAAADQRPVLRSEVHTLSEIVTVGDFYSNAGLVSQKPLFRSPDFGTTGTVPAAMVAERAKAAGLASASTDGLRQVVVHRRAELFDQARLKSLVAETLANQDASLDVADLNITLFSNVGTIQANPAAEQLVQVNNVLWSRSDGRFTISFSFAGEYDRTNVSLNGHAQEMLEVTTLLQPLKTGQILRLEDLTTTRMPRTKVPANAVGNPDEVVGLAARSSLRANMPLARNDFTKPILISRGEKVTITYVIGGMKLTTRGKAMDDGAKGEPIDIMNLDSRRIVPAMVLSRGQVLAQPAHAQIASAEGQIQ
ncbi:flagellar basal body P-ring formation chaperone FlgA [Roseibium sediminis]|uniref:flagellar basal body P-ring formation chaperone FlgA n=1 Tax=Roseibium sediminis TaxID=1775174 RepID=UPI00123D3545|nr:flagellar basal body P-ring formation chaperone FlgA [Roseibium sediminis]